MKLNIHSIQGDILNYGINLTRLKTKLCISSIISWSFHISKLKIVSEYFQTDVSHSPWAWEWRWHSTSYWAPAFQLAAWGPEHCPPASAEELLADLWSSDSVLAGLCSSHPVLALSWAVSLQDDPCPLTSVSWALTSCWPLSRGLLCRHGLHGDICGRSECTYWGLWRLSTPFCLK